MKRKVAKHEFVEFIPEALDEGTVYVSIRFATSVHKCMCGCGSKVVTPLSPTGWELRFDGRSISLYPSVGSWNLPCKSHYWIRKDKVEWARRWSQEEVNQTRALERQEREGYFEHGAASTDLAKGKRRGQRRSP